MGGDAGSNYQLRMFVIGDLWIFGDKGVEDNLAQLLPVGIRALRFVGGNFACRLVATAPSRQKDDRRQQIKIAK